MIEKNINCEYCGLTLKTSKLEYLHHNTCICKSLYELYQLRIKYEDIETSLSYINIFGLYHSYNPKYKITKDEFINIIRLNFNLFQFKNISYSLIISNIINSNKLAYSLYDMIGLIHQYCNIDKNLIYKIYLVNQYKLNKACNSIQI
jgi:hypothetical protein